MTKHILSLFISDISINKSIISGTPSLHKCPTRAEIDLSSVKAMLVRKENNNSEKVLSKHK